MKIFPLFILMLLVWCCGTKSGSPPADLPSTPETPAPLVEDFEPHILPFPEHFSLARRDLSGFAGTVDIGEGELNKKVQKQPFGLMPVLHSRFGCYTLGPTDKWEGGDADCGSYDIVFTSRDTLFQHENFVLYPFYDESAYKRPILSVWEVRGDSLDFFTILSQGFEPEDEQAEIRIDSVKIISADQRQIFGKISWEGGANGRVVSSWSALWTFPDQLDIR